MKNASRHLTSVGSELNSLALRAEVDRCKTPELEICDENDNLKQKLSGLSERA